jgi:hypothetical protein
MTVGGCSCSVPEIEELREAPWTNSVQGSGRVAARGGAGSGLISKMCLTLDLVLCEENTVGEEHSKKRGC